MEELFHTKAKDNYIIFILKASKAVTAPIFTPKSLSSLGGRMDLVARAIIAALYEKNRLRKNIMFISVLEGPPNPPKTLIFDSNRFSRVVISEKEIGSLILSSFRKNYYDGIYLFDLSFRDLVIKILKFFKKSSIAYLEESGVDIRTLSKNIIRKTNIFILGDHKGIDRENEKWLEKEKIPKISIGPLSYLASHTITILLEEKIRIEDTF